MSTDARTFILNLQRVLLLVREFEIGPISSTGTAFGIREPVRLPVRRQGSQPAAIQVFEAR